LRGFAAFGVDRIGATSGPLREPSAAPVASGGRILGKMKGIGRDHGGRGAGGLSRLDPGPAGGAVALAEAAGRVLAEPVFATRDQPPFAASAMDGYAVRIADAVPGARLRVVGEAPAGRAWAGEIGPGEALRIFTGAPMPQGAERVVIQEDVTRDGAEIVIGEGSTRGPTCGPPAPISGPARGSRRRGGCRPPTSRWRRR
jgi:hypothetical protein